MELKKCLFCSQEFKFKRKSQNFCSKKCYWNYRNRKKRNLPCYQILVKKCLVCSKEFTLINIDKKYCSKKCSRDYNRRKKRNIALYTVLVKKCFFCSKKFTATRVDQKYCSKKCQNIYNMRKKRNIDLNLPVNYNIKGFFVDKKGYKKIWKPSHPNADKGGYVSEHRLLMSEAIGRSLRKDETVHHINGDRLDNRIENLELRDGAHGPGQRVIDKIQHSISYLQKHGCLDLLFKAWKKKEFKLNHKEHNADPNEGLCKQYELPIMQDFKPAPPEPPSNALPAASISFAFP